MRFIFVFAFFFLSIAKGAESEFPTFERSKLSDLYAAKISSEMIARWSSGERKPAQAGARYGESDLSADFKKIRTKILSVNTADDLEARLSELNSEYLKLSNDAKFFAANLLLLKPLRGVIWRLRPLFEKKDGNFDFFSGNKGTHSAAVGMMRWMFHTTKIYLPTAQGNALFDYLTIPSKKMRLSQQFTKVYMFQNFLMTDVLNSLDDMTRVINSIKTINDRPYKFDAKVLYGSGAFDDGVARYVAFDDPEVLLTLAMAEGSKHSIKVFAAYDQEQLMNVMGRLGKLYGVDGFGTGDGNLGVTSLERRNELESFRSRGFLKKRSTKDNPYGDNLMKDALLNLQASVSNLRDAYDIVNKLPASSRTLLNPLFFKAEAQPRLDRGVTKLTALMYGKESIRSGVTGESVSIDVPTFYNKSPDNILDLLPDDFQSASKGDLSVINDAKETLMYRDYSAGRPISWKVAEWQKLFPGTTSSNLTRTFRTLEYSDIGASVIFGPLSYFVY